MVPLVPQKSQQILQPRSDAEKSDTISMKATPQEVFVNPFPQDLESLFLEKDAVSTEFAIKDKNIVKHKSTLV